MASNLNKYKNLVKNLLPTGFAWELVREHPLVEALAGELCRVGDRTSDFLVEIDPRQATELLEEWEAMVGLPDECTPDNLDINDRRNQVAQKLATVGALSKSFYESLGLFYGYDINVTNHVQFQVGKSRVGEDLTNNNIRQTMRVGTGTVGTQLRTFAWVHYFNAELPASSADYLQVGEGRVGERLVVFSNELIQCTIRKLKPAHAGVTFTFKNP